MADGWPVVDYCRAGVHALQCHHDDVWIRNASRLALHDVRICVAPAARAYFQIAGAGADGCLHAELGARASQPAPFEKYRVPECTTHAQPGPGQVHSLSSGMSCALLVGTTDIHASPYARHATPAASTPGPRRVLMIGRLIDKVLGRSAPKPQASEPGPSSVKAELGLRFREAAGQGGDMLKWVTLKAGSYAAVGGEFTRGGSVDAPFALPMPALMLLDKHGFHAPLGLDLEPQSVVSAIGLSADGTHLCLGGACGPACNPGRRCRFPTWPAPTGSAGISPACRTVRTAW